MVYTVLVFIEFYTKNVIPSMNFLRIFDGFSGFLIMEKFDLDNNHQVLVFNFN